MCHKIIVVLLLLSGCVACQTELPYHLTDYDRMKNYVVGDLKTGLSVENYYITKDYDPASDSYLEGIAKIEGDSTTELVPPIYTNIKALSETLAFVRRNNSLSLINIQTNTLQPIPSPQGVGEITTSWSGYTQCWDSWWLENQACYQSWIWISCEGQKPNSHDIVLLGADGKTRLIQAGVAGAAEFMGDFVYFDVGNGLYSTYSYSGEYLAKGLPHKPVAFHRGVDEGRHPGLHVHPVAQDLVCATGHSLVNTPEAKLDYLGKGLYLNGSQFAGDPRMAFWDANVYQPMNQEGQRIALPEGCLGLMRMVTHMPGTSAKKYYTSYEGGLEGKHLEDGYHSGWALVYLDVNNGYQFSFFQGSAIDAIDVAPSLERYKNWEQASFYNSDDFLIEWQPARAFAQRVSDDQWVALDMETMKPLGLKPCGFYIEPLAEPMMHSDLAILKKILYEGYDLYCNERADAYRNDVELERQAWLAGRDELVMKEFDASIEQMSYQRAKNLLVNQRVPEAQRQTSWLRFYETFGFVSRYDADHAREIGMSEDRIAFFENDFQQWLTADAVEQAAIAEAERIETAKAAAYYEATHQPIYVEKLEIRYEANGTVTLIKTKVPF